MFSFSRIPLADWSIDANLSSQRFGPTTHRQRTAVGFIAGLGLALCVSSAGAGSAVPSQHSAQLLAAPMHFEANAGQVDDQVSFVSRGQGYTLFLTPTQALLSLRTPTKRAAEKDSASPKVSRVPLEMTLVGANAHAHAEGVDKLPGTANYFIGNDPAQWRTGVPTFGKVRYRQVYPGVDLVYYGNQRQIEYDFIVNTNADPRQIIIDLAGADRLEVDQDGSLVAHLPGGAVRWQKPFAYQQTDAGRQEIPAKFVLKKKRQAGFELAAYDRTRPLVIDPLLSYATYLGGSGSDFVSGIAVDSGGNVYVIGDTSSLNFPTKNAYRSTAVGSNDVFVTKLNSTGTALVYSTYLGGNGNDYAGGIALDSSGNAYLTGETDSQNFPIKNPAYAANSGGLDAFVTKLGPNGTNLVYSTYLGGGGDERGRAIAVDASGNAYVAGRTYSLGTGNSPFPTTHGAYQADNGGGNTVSADAFVAKFDANGLLSYSTFLGGHSDETAHAIAVDSGGNAYVVGQVSSQFNFPNPPSSDFPVVNAFQPTFNRGSTNDSAGFTDGFLTKLNSTGTGLIFSTFLGGNQDDSITGIALDPTGRICLTGFTSSPDFPTLNAAQSLNGGSVLGDPDFPGMDAFVTMLQSNGTSLVYSTYLGGSEDEYVSDTLARFGIAVDNSGQMYVAGRTSSVSDFPVTPGADQADTNSVARSLAYVAKINPSVSGPASLIYASFVGGEQGVLTGASDNEAGPIAVDTSGNFYVAGITSTTNFPVSPAAFRSTNSGGFSDVFISKFRSPADLSVTLSAATNLITRGSNLTFVVQINNNGNSQFTGVTNRVQFPTNVQFGAITTSLGSSSATNGLITFQIGTLASNATVTQTMVVTFITPGSATNTATLTSNETFQEPNTVNNVASFLTTVRGIADVRLTVNAPSAVSLTSNLTYTIGINNRGPDPATSVLLSNALSPLVTFISASNSFGTCSNVGSALLCDFGTLTNSASAQVTIYTMASASGTAANYAIASGLEADFSFSNNSATTNTTINPLSDLTLVMTASTNSVYAGSNVTYTLSVRNLGPSDATGVVLTNPLPAGATLISATPSAMTNLSSGVVAFNFGTMVSNALVTATITVRLNSAGTVTNSATLTSPATDPNPGNNSAFVTTTVNAQADLAVSQTVLPTSTLVSSNVTFTIVVTNRGVSTANNVVLNDVLPSAVSFVSAQWNQGSWSQANGVVTFNASTLTNAGTATATVVARTLTDGTFSNTANVTNDVTDLVSGNNSASATFTVNDNPTLPLLKITRSASNVILSWSTNAQSFFLQSKPDFSPSSVWTDVTNTPVRVGNQWMVTNSISDAAKFYRLNRRLPVLSATMVSSNRVVVSWPATAAGGVLKTTTNLQSSSVWIVISNPPPVIVGDRYYVTNLVSGSRRFYRLYD